MKILRMTTDQLTTDERIADALIEYAMVLGKADDSDTVVLPVVRDGRLEQASILLGPSSQITITESHDDDDARVLIPDVQGVLDDLNRRIRIRRGHDAMAEDPGGSDDSGLQEFEGY